LDSKAPIILDASSGLRPLWQPRDSKREVKDPVPGLVQDKAPEASCEFVGDPIYKGSSGRKCRFGGCCFLFGDVALYASCPSRIEKLKEKA
jgi:hypothetical protein